MFSKYLIFKLPISSEIFDLSKNQQSPICVFGIFGRGSWARKFYLKFKLKRYVKKPRFLKEILAYILTINNATSRRLLAQFIFLFFIFGLHGPHKNRGWFVPMCNIKKVNLWPFLLRSPRQSPFAEKFFGLYFNNGAFWCLKKDFFSVMKKLGDKK